MVSYRNCRGCEHLLIGLCGIRCTYPGKCANKSKKKKGKPVGYRTPEDFRRMEYRDGR